MSAADKPNPPLSTIEEGQRKRLEWHAAFGDRLRATRALIGITEQEAAAACLIALRTYRKREAGLPYHGWHVGLLSFMQKYDVSPDWMLAGEGRIFKPWALMG